ISLPDLIGKVARGQLPVNSLVKTPEELTHTWKWTVPIDDGGKDGKKFFGILTYHNVDSPQSGVKVSLNIRVVTSTKLPKPSQVLAGAKPTGTVRLDAYFGHWDTRSDQPSPSQGSDPKTTAAFSLSLLEMINLYFRQVRIEADYLVGESPKPRIKPEIVNVEFDGPLKFVSRLQAFLGNLGGGFRLALLPSFLELSYGFMLPPVSFGAFSLRNIQLRAGLMLPFADDPLRFSFGISSFAVPFELVVMCFGGRGYLRVEIDTKGGRTLEGALEFGGSLAFDVGVASGGLYVMAGIYFKITQSGTSLAGYLRAGGNLNVLGLIHVNVEFLLMVTYRSTDTGDSELYGQCTLTISIELFMFSISVNVTLEKRIAGSKGSGGQAGRTSLDSGWPALAAANPAAWVTLLDAGDAAKPGKKKSTLVRRTLDRTYFRRSDVSGPDEDGRPMKGRFDWDDYQPAAPARRWVSEYWSQFDFTRN
ncbi:MAG TPA: hypothetical protein VH120_04845, partial [Gemmataceae bacterium]|nr:hypothetical protein [Gemmataceae bacterium]